MDSRVLSQVVEKFRLNDNIKNKMRELIKEIYKDIDITIFENEDDLRLVEAQISRTFISGLEFEMGMHLISLIRGLKKINNTEDDMKW